MKISLMSIIFTTIFFSTSTLFGLSENAEDATKDKENVDYDGITKVFKSLDKKNIYTLKEYTPEKLKNLKRVYLSKSKVTDEDLKILSQLPNVLLWNLGASGKLTPECQVALKKMTSARIIDLVLVKAFKDYDEVVDTFKDHKNLQLISLNTIKGKEPTEKYKSFLKERPNLQVLIGSYKDKDHRTKHKSTVQNLVQKWIDDGVITYEEASTFAGKRFNKSSK